MPRILELGSPGGVPIPRPFQPDVGPEVWVKFRAGTHATQGDGFVLGRKCKSLNELETVINQLRSELDGILREAKTKLGHGD
jgi:hypothetical protein